VKIRADVTALLRDGLTNTQIANRLHISRATAAAARAALGLPRCTADKHRPISIEDLLRARSQQTDDGHWLWTGPLDQGRVPRVRLNGCLYSPYRAAFTIRTGRAPVGPVTPGCGIRQCIAPACMDDTPARRQTAATYRALFGGAL